MTIESHYGRPMDIEWAKDGLDGKLYIVQARPETVASQRRGSALETYVLDGRARSWPRDARSGRGSRQARRG